MTFDEYASITKIEYVAHKEKPIRASLRTLGTGEVVMRVDKYRKTPTGNTEEMTFKRGVSRDDVLRSFNIISFHEFCVMGVEDCSNT